MAAADKAVAVVLDFGTTTRQGETTTNAVAAVNGPALLLKHNAATTTTTTTVSSSRDDDRTGPELLCPDRMVKIILLVVYVSSPVAVAMTAICSRIHVAKIPNVFHVHDVAKHKTRIFRINSG
jgi:hypothetical protein